MLRFAIPLAATVAILFPAAALPAQHHHGHDGDAPLASPASHRAHLRLSTARTATLADSARAAELERTLLAYLGRYRDVRAAEADGYRKFAPRVESQRVFHYTNRRHAVRNAFSFDAARPTSLLYRRGASGELELAGAMYTAPARATDAELDARVPLGVGQWHQHVDICLPRRWSERGHEAPDDAPRFGPAGSIVTREACSAAGGRWLPRVFGWMIHANLEQTVHGARISWEHEH